MAQLEGISTIVPVADTAASISFYVDVLGFELRHHDENTGFALFARDHASVMLVRAADDAALAATRNNISSYIWVRDLDALWAELSPALNTLPEGRVRAPFVQSYGMREFHVKDPDGFLIFFGENADTEGA